MLCYKFSTDCLLSCFRKYRCPDLKILCFSCSIILVGCVLAYMTWSLGAPGLFLILYVFLGTVGLLISYLRKTKLTNIFDETSPVLPKKHLKLNADQEYEQLIDKFKDLLNEALINSNKNCNQKYLTETQSVTEYKENNFSELDASETQINIKNLNKNPISCIETNYDARVTREDFATGPSPGGSYSKTSNDSDREQSRSKRLTPLLSPFRQSPPTEASAIFHVPLTELSYSQEDADHSHLPGNSSVYQSQSIKDVLNESVATNSSVNLVSQQPIYENIDKHQETERIFSESDWKKLLKNETPSKPLRPINDTEGSLFHSYEVPNSVADHNDKIKRPQRVGPFISDGIYATLHPSVEERQGESHVLSSSVPDHRLQSHQRSKPFISPNRIYANVYSSVEERHGEPQVHILSSSAPDHRQLITGHNRIYANVCSSVEEKHGELQEHILSSSAPDRRQQSHQLIKTFISPERIYANVHSTIEETPEESFLPTLANSAPGQYDRLEGHQRIKSYTSPDRIYFSLEEIRGEQSGNMQFISTSDSTQSEITNDKNEETQLYNENIYMNTNALHTQTEEKSVQSKISCNSLEIGNMSENFTSAVSLQPERIYMNLPTSYGEKHSSRKSKIIAEVNDSLSADTETDFSRIEEHSITAENTTLINRRDMSKTRSDYMYVTCLGTTNCVKSSPQYPKTEPNNDNSEKPENDNSEKPENDNSEVPRLNAKDSSNITGMKITEAHIVSDKNSPLTNYLSSEELKSKNIKQSKNHLRAPKIDSSMKNYRIRGMNLGEFLSLKNPTVEKSRLENKFKTADSVSLNRLKMGGQVTKTEYDNPLYGENVAIFETEVGNLTKTVESVGKLSSTDKLVANQMNTTKTVESSSNDHKTVLNETFLVNEVSNSSTEFVEKSNIKKFPESDTTFVKQTCLRSSDDEDSIFLSKSIQDETQNFVSSDSARSSFDRSSISNGSYLQPFSKYLSSSSRDSKLQFTENSGNAFSLIKQTESVLAARIDERFSKDISNNTSIKGLTQSPEGRNNSNRLTPPSKLKKSPHILPPLDKTYFSPPSDSTEVFSQSKILDLPVIINQSPAVKSQRQKFTAVGADKNRSSVPTLSPLSKSAKQVVRSSRQSLGTTQRLELQHSHSKNRSSLSPTILCPRKDSITTRSLTTPKELERSSRYLEKSPNI